MRSRKGGQRSDRVAAQIQEVLASLLLFDVNDPRLKRVQITGVECTPDLKFADVYFIAIDADSPEPEEDVIEAVEKSAGFLRKMLSDRLEVRYTPELRFAYDESVARGRRIEALLAEVVPAEEVVPGEPGREGDDE